MVGPMELLVVAVLGVPMLVIAAAALWLLARMVHSQERYDPSTAKQLAKMQDGMEKMEARLASLEEVMLDPDKTLVRRYN